MCVIYFAYQQHPNYPLILLANRDEFYDRPTRQAKFWEDEPQLLAGRDLKAQGTWLGITKSGRFAAITNIRNPASMREDMRSRGMLIKDFLCSDRSPEAYLRTLTRDYNGFNLIVADHQSLFYLNSEQFIPQKLGSGIYGLSNHRLDTAWPKVKKGKHQLKQWTQQPASLPIEAMLAFMQNEEIAPTDQLPDTGIGQEWEKILSSIFICSERYGTRSTTLLFIDHQGEVTFVEQTHDRLIEGNSRVTRKFHIQPSA